jgi:hypothetical protein
MHNTHCCLLIFLQVRCPLQYVTIPSSIRGERVVCSVHSTQHPRGPLTRHDWKVQDVRKHRRRSDCASNHPRTACPERWFRPTNPKHAFGRQVTLRLRCTRIQLQLLVSTRQHQPWYYAHLSPPYMSLCPQEYNSRGAHQPCPVLSLGLTLLLCHL